jgi:hypothetical protein
MADYPWLVGRVEMYGSAPTDCMPVGGPPEGGDRQAQIWALVRELDLDPKLLRTYCVFTQDREGYKVHFSQHLLRDGKPFVDIAEDRVATEPVVRDISREQIPSWLRPPE